MFFFFTIVTRVTKLEFKIMCTYLHYSEVVQVHPLIFLRKSGKKN